LQYYEFKRFLEEKIKNKNGNIYQNEFPKNLSTLKLNYFMSKLLENYGEIMHIGPMNGESRPLG
jgi:hypothetical protein